MTTQEICRIWLEVTEDAVLNIKLIELFAQKVAAAEREACAKECEVFGQTLEVDVGPNFAEAIRARGGE